MLEIPLCIYCHQAVLVDDQDYVIMNKRATHSSDWEYAHAACRADCRAADCEAPEDLAVGRSGTP